MMKSALSTVCTHALVIGLLAPALTGCAALQGDPVPPPPPPPEPAVLSSGQSPEAPERWLERDDSGAVQAFVPLEQARQAVSKAAESQAVAEFAAEDLEKAQSALARAEKRWQEIASSPLKAPRKLAGAAHHAHQAKRLGQIAWTIGARESGLRQLSDAQKTLERREAQDARWVGRELIPGQLGEVRFTPGTAQLTGDSGDVIGTLAEFLRQHPRYGLRLIGHTDSRPPSESHLEAFLEAHPEVAERDQDERARAAAYNKAMSRRRARAVRQALVDAGIESSRLRVEARGATDPVADNATAAGRRKNRRVEAVVILPKGKSDS